MDQQSKQWAMFIHFSQFAGIVVPLAGFILPIVLWQMKRVELPETDAHGKMVVNWIISEFVYWVIGIVLVFLLIGIPLLLVLVALGIVFPIIGGIKANEGELWNYPLTITFIR